ncbi:hypothetical protein LZ31DRAFT_83150 [Colletotrichum somersetense]|nr:hypothetical protein LZ31DRAFT_83150 [Colletotrichum somersetense]
MCRSYFLGLSVYHSLALPLFFLFLSFFLLAFPLSTSPSFLQPNRPSYHHPGYELSPARVALLFYSDLLLSPSPPEGPTCIDFVVKLPKPFCAIHLA